MFFNAQLCQHLTTLTENEVWGSLSPLHFQSTMSKFCIRFCQKYQHPPYVTQLIWLDSNYSSDNGNNEQVMLLFHNVSLAHANLRVVTMHAAPNVEGIHWQKGHWDDIAQHLAHLVHGPWEMAGLLRLAFPMEEETWGQHKIDSWTGESIGLESILRNLWMGMIIPDCCYIIMAARVACVELWNDEKNSSTTGLWPCLGCNPLYFRKTHPGHCVRYRTQSQRYLS